MSTTIATLAILAAFVSGWGFSGMLDAVWGYTEWDELSVAYVTAIWTIAGALSVGLVLAL